MMCNRSLKGSSAWIGSGSLALASEPLRVMPAGMQVFGSKPWFCRKKITRFGPPLEALELAWLIPGNRGEAKAVLAVAAI